MTSRALHLDELLDTVLTRAGPKLGRFVRRQPELADDLLEGVQPGGAVSQREANAVYSCGGVLYRRRFSWLTYDRKSPPCPPPFFHTRKAEANDFVETVQGTFGTAAAADTIIVVKRRRDQADATLHITGRDVEEQELALNVPV